MARRFAGLAPCDHHASTPDLQWVIGFDEVGVGCLAGPVVAAGYAYALKPCDWYGSVPPHVVRDSKKMSPQARDVAEAWLRGSQGFFEIVEVEPAEIDRINILKAAQLAMSRCFGALKTRILEIEPVMPRTAVLIDGNRLPAAFAALEKPPFFPETIVKGDDKSFAIAAASILAKTHRDRLMDKLGAEFPEYGWESNAGYPTPDHKAAIREFGPTDHHRRSFNWL